MLTDNFNDLPPSYNEAINSPASPRSTARVCLEILDININDNLGFEIEVIQPENSFKTFIYKILNGFYFLWITHFSFFKTVTLFCALFLEDFSQLIPIHIKFIIIVFWLFIERLKLIKTVFKSESEIFDMLDFLKIHFLYLIFAIGCKYNFLLFLNHLIIYILIVFLSIFNILNHLKPFFCIFTKTILNIFVILTIHLILLISLFDYISYPLSNFFKSTCILFIFDSIIEIFKSKKINYILEFLTSNLFILCLAQYKYYCAEMIKSNENN